MKKRIGLLVILLSLILCSSVDAMTFTWNQSSSHRIMLDALSWVAYEVDCQDGNILSGSFKVECDGSLYVGDEQKYDDWSLEGIEFYILDAGNYSLFNEREPFETAYVRNNVLSLSWTFEIPSDGVWYIVYDNRSIYLMEIDGSANRTDDSNFMIALILITLGGISALGVILVIKRK